MNSPEAASALGLPDWVDRVRTRRLPEDVDTLTPLVEHAVHGLIQAGKVGALVAAGGTGKTTLLITLGICHATGRAFMGLHVARGTFLLLSADDTQEDLDGAVGLVMRAMRLTEGEREAVHKNLRVVSLLGESGTRKFTTLSSGAVVETGFVDLVLHAIEGMDKLVGIAFDTLRQFAGGSTNDDQTMIATIGGATEIALVTGAYVILPHHTGKAGFREATTDLYCGTGSAAIADNARFVLLLQATTWPDVEAKIKRTGNEAGDPLVLMSTRGSLLMKAPPPLYLYRDRFLIGRVAGSELTAGQAGSARDRAILSAVRHGARSKNAILAAIGGNRRAVQQRVDELEGLGLLVTGGSGGGTAFLAVSMAGIDLLDAPE